MVERWVEKKMSASEWLTSVYRGCPPFVQNVMVSGYGILLRNQRFGGRASEYACLLRKTETYSRDEMREFQENEFVRIVRHAVERVPFYRDWAANCGLRIGRIQSMSDIRNLPIVSKTLVRSDPSRFCAGRVRVGSGAFVLNTSGTSGTPLTIYCDKDSRRKHYAFFTRLRSWFGVGRGDRRATFFGRALVDPSVERPPFWRYDAAQRNLLFSSYHLSDTNFGHYYRKLLRFRPKEVIGYPSSLFALAIWIADRRLEPVPANVVVTTAETLLAHQREAIERAFAAPVIDQYGCTEMSHFVSQCEYGTYHVHPEHGIIEILDEENQEVEPGRAGRAICTGFVNYTMPLLRYEIGDRIRKGRDGCLCGRPFPVISEIEGRADDVLVTPDGRRLGRLDPVFKGQGGIRETQIVQTATNRIEVRVVATDEFTPLRRKALERALRERIGLGVEVAICTVPEIEKGANGKFKAVISLLGVGG